MVILAILGLLILLGIILNSLMRYVFPPTPVYLDSMLEHEPRTPIQAPVWTEKKVTTYREPQVNEGNTEEEDARLRSMDTNELRAYYGLSPVPVSDIELKPQTAPKEYTGPVVVKTAPAKYETECGTCHCTFEYRYSDTSPGIVYRRVTCPSCGNECLHS